MKKLLIVLMSLILVCFMGACGDQGDDQQSNQGNVSSEGSWEEKYGALVNVDYDAILASLPELTEEEQNKVVEIGFRDCDHMVAGPIGEAAGIYENMGIKFNLTKTGKVYDAMSAGQMDAAYMGFATGQVTAINNGAPFCIVSGNHTGGSWYLVVTDDIQTPEDLIGKRLAIGSEAETTTGWVEVATAIGAPVETDNYEVFDMKDADEFFAFQNGQLDGFTCCDPWGSYVEYLGIGHIMATSWGSATAETSGETAGIHCVLGANRDFLEQYPNLAVRLMYAHVLSIQYLYQHPYKAAEIFSEYFDVPLEVSLMTVYNKIVKEGRTINWEMSEDNFQTWFNEYERWGITGENAPALTMDELDKVWDHTAMDAAYEAGCPVFSEFISEKVDKVFPVGMTYEEFETVAKEIDGIE